MATNPNDKKENAGARGFFRKNFGRDEKGRSFLGNVFNGVTDGPTLGQSIRKHGFFATFCAVSLVVHGTAFVADQAQSRVDIDLQSYETISAEEQQQFSAYEYNGNRYLLQVTDEGSRLFEQSKDENLSEVDDVFTLVTPDRAEDIAREIALIYRMSIDTGNAEDRIWFDSDLTGEEPSIIEYEGLSHIFTQSESGEVYVIGDNTNEDALENWSGSPVTLTQGYENWREALTHFVDGEILDGDVYMPSEDYLEQSSDKTLDYLLMAMGGLAALGGGLGGVSSVASSRRRHNKELKNRP